MTTELRRCKGPECDEFIPDDARSDRDTCSPRCRLRLSRWRRAQDAPSVLIALTPREATAMYEALAVRGESLPPVGPVTTALMSWWAAGAPPRWSGR